MNISKLNSVKRLITSDERSLSTALLNTEYFVGREPFGKFENRILEGHESTYSHLCYGQYVA